VTHHDGLQGQLDSSRSAAEIRQLCKVWLRLAIGTVGVGEKSNRVVPDHVEGEGTLCKATSRCPSVAG